MKRQIMGLMLATGLLGAGYAQAGLVIDNFDTPQTQLERHDLGSTPGSASGPGIVGGTRDVTLTITKEGINSAQKGRTDVTDSVMSLSNDSGVKLSVTLTYDNLGGVDLNGPNDDKPWLIFHVLNIDKDLVVDVTLTDTDEPGADVAQTAHNRYVKLDSPATARFDCVGADGVGPATEQCPQIVGPIYNVDVDNNIEGNYYHGLGAFLSGGTDPVTGLPFGTGGPINPLLDLNHIDKIVISYTANVSNQQASLSCVHTGAAPSGTSTAKVGPGDITFPLNGGDDAESAQCTIVPEPGSILLLGTGFLGIGLVGIRARLLRRRQQA